MIILHHYFHNISNLSSIEKIQLLLILVRKITRSKVKSMTKQHVIVIPPPYTKVINDSRMRIILFHTYFICVSFLILLKFFPACPSKLFIFQHSKLITAFYSFILHARIWVSSAYLFIYLIQLLHQLFYSIISLTQISFMKHQSFYCAQNINLAMI